MPGSVKLVCPQCGGDPEMRGNVRFYEQGRVVVKPDGAREWIGSSWDTAVETLVLDDPPYHCRRCDASLTLEVLVPSPGRPIRETGRWRTHLAVAPECLRTACGMTVTGWMRLDDSAEVDCPACREAVGALLPASRVGATAGSG